MRVFEVLLYEFPMESVQVSEIAQFVGLSDTVTSDWLYRMQERGFVEMQVSDDHACIGSRIFVIVIFIHHHTSVATTALKCTPQLIASPVYKWPAAAFTLIHPLTNAATDKESRVGAS
jgi:DNA-binding IclR family transcriptional regulator